MKKHLITALVSLLLFIPTHSAAKTTEALDVRSIKKKSDSFLQDYQAAQHKTKKVKPHDMSGEWTGLMSCGSGNFPVSLNLDKEADNEYSGEITIQHEIGHPNKKTPTIAEHVGRKATLKYDPNTHTFSIETPRTAATPGAREYGLYMYGMLNPKKGNTARVSMLETSEVRRGASCELGVLAKGAEGKKLNTTIKNIAKLQNNREPVTQTECPKKYRKWMDKTKEFEPKTRNERLVYRLLEDEYFEPVFGKPFFEMDAEKLIEAYKIIMGSCAILDDPKRKYDHSFLGSALGSYKSYTTASVNAIQNEIIDNWIEWITSELENGLNLPHSDLVSVQGTALRILGRKSEQYLAFNERIAPLIEQSRYKNKQLNYVHRLENVKDDFRKLMILQSNATQHEDINDDIIKRGLDYYLVSAARSFAENAKDKEDAIYMSAWHVQHGNKETCPSLDTSICKDVSNIFEEKSLELASQFAQQEEQSFSEFKKGKKTLARLKQVIAFNNRLNDEYRLLLDTKPFAGLQKDLRKSRQKLQKSLRKDLLAEVKKNNTSTSLNALQKQYFIDDDIQASSMKAIKKEIASILQTTTPFDGFSNGEYFNALYNKDFEKLRALDNQLLKKIKPLMALGTEQAAALGPLVDMMTGAKQGTTQRQLYKGLQNVSVLNAVMGTYMLEYQNAYKSCLKPNATILTITTQTDTVTRNSWGNEISRIKGWTTEDHYKINPEFAGHFRALFGEAKPPELQQLFDFFVNDGNITKIRSATRAIMAEKPCTSPEIKQLEEGFLAYSNELARRMR